MTLFKSENQKNVLKTKNEIATTENSLSEKENLSMATSFVHKEQIIHKRYFNTFYYVSPSILHWQCTHHILLSYQSCL
jgi:non-homologous end joining protein Ku